MHLGEHATADEALMAWTNDIRRLQMTRPRKADKLRAKMERLEQLMGGGEMADPNAGTER